MAGHMVSLYLREHHHDVIGFARSQSKFIETIIGDAKSLELLHDIICNGNFDVIINCIGMLNQFAENNHEEAVFLNSYLPHYLAQITENTSTQIIHLSTDCVFSGRRGSYTENDFTDGTSFYDRSKALGELIDSKNVTLRTSIIGPDIKKQGIGLLNWFMQQNGQIKGYKNAIWTGQTTLQLAKTIEQATMQKVNGLYNIVPKNKISKCDLLMLCNIYLRKNPIKIVIDESFKIDKSLIRTNYCGFSYEVPDYEIQIQELSQWMRLHKEIYPHYY